MCTLVLGRGWALLRIGTLNINNKGGVALGDIHSGLGLSRDVHGVCTVYEVSCIDVVKYIVQTETSRFKYIQGLGYN